MLIFFHELGHFLFAKLFKVKVIKFSIGMGPAILKYKGKETTYVLAAIPIGGYVSMLGQDPTAVQRPEDRGRSLNDKENWKRFLVMFAGPAFNLILPFILYFIYALFDTAHISPIIGQHSNNGPIAKSELRDGDKITSLDDIKIRYWSDLSKVLDSRAGKKIPISYERNNKEYKSYIQLTKDENTDKIKIYEYKARLGITPFRDRALVYLKEDKYKIKNFDLIEKINGKKLLFKEELKKYKDIPKLKIHVKRPKRISKELFDMFILEDVILEDVDSSFINEMLAPEMAVWSVHPDSVAKKLGIKRGDYILSVNDRKFNYWIFLQDYLSLQKNKEIKIKILRDSKIIGLSFKQKLIEAKNVSETSYYEFGVVPYIIPEASKLNPIIVSDNVLRDASSEMIYQTFLMTRLVFTAVFQLITGNLGFEHLGGPIMMYEASGIALQYGWLSLLKLMALLSINLGLLNLLPIPMLDGGHILFILVEMIRRKPVNQRFKEIASFIGLSILVILMILVFKNDIENFIFK